MGTLFLFTGHTGKGKSIMVAWLSKFLLLVSQKPWWLNHWINQYFNHLKPGSTYKLSYCLTFLQRFAYTGFYSQFCFQVYEIPNLYLHGYIGNFFLHLSPTLFSGIDFYEWRKAQHSGKWFSTWLRWWNRMRQQHFHATSAC